MLKSENVVVIHGWMCNELELKGNELLIFALIYGFSCDGVSSFFGSRKYIAETFNISLPTVDKALNGLLDKNFICKDNSNGFPDVYYYNEGVVKKLYMGCKETLQGGVKKLYRGCKETLPNNISNNKKPIQKTISKDIVQNLVQEDKPKKKNQFQKCLDMVNDYTTNSELREKLLESYKLFNENSREAGRPFYANNFKGKLNTLSELATDSATQIKIVEQTLKLGYNSFYELKNDKNDKLRRRTGNAAHDIEQLYNGMNEKADKRCADGEKF